MLRSLPELVLTGSIVPAANGDPLPEPKLGLKPQRREAPEGAEHGAGSQPGGVQEINGL